MPLTVQSTGIYLHNLRTRLPFRYGIAVMTDLPAVFLRAECEINGQIQAGVASDVLPPKWFTKNPDTSYRADVADMLKVIETAASFAKELGEVPTVFDMWQQLHTAQQLWAEAEGFPPLLWNFGVSLVERAVIEVFCRVKNTTLAVALRANTLGIRLSELHPELAGQAPADLLPAQPRRCIIARHTVGMADPIFDREIAETERLDDGLPQSLEACIRTYGLSHFKIKVSGDTTADIGRLRQVAALLQENQISKYAFTIDGNEQFKNVHAFQEFWQEIKRDRNMDSFLSRLLFVEQPLPRDVALDGETRTTLHFWADSPPIIIDESDSLIDSLPVALECGYAGTSHKNCKGIFKGIANACLLEHHRRNDLEGVYILSGEDLANVGPVALLQDLATMANLGIEHVERNGHHYFAGLSMFPPQLQAEMLTYHPDLYRRHDRGFATMNIKDGTISVDSLVEASFGVGFKIDLSQFIPLHAWCFDSIDSSENKL